VFELTSVYASTQLARSAAPRVFNGNSLNAGVVAARRAISSSSRWNRPEPEKPLQPASSSSSSTPGPSSSPKASAETSKLYTERARTGGVSVDLVRCAEVACADPIML
jgi:hypothetical protein